MGTLRSNAKGMQEMIPSAIPLIFFQVAFYVFLVQATDHCYLWYQIIK